MSETSRPYRSTPGEREPASPPPRRPWVRPRFLVALGASVCVGVVAARRPTERPGFGAVPDALRNAPRVLVLGLDPLPIAAPLDPLLARDRPEALAVVEPRDGAARFERGEPVVVRFNRPMVRASLVGRALDVHPLRFEPPLRGRARWVNRSTLHFVAEESTWSQTREVTLTVSDELRALSGERLSEAVSRVLVFDGAPRLVGPTSVQRVAVGAPLRLRFEGAVDVPALASQLVAYELGGGLRPLTVQPRDRGADSEGRRLVELVLGRRLEPGARVGVAFAPGLRADRSSDEEQPGTLSFEFAPRPQLEGVGCEADASSTEACRYGTRPGHIVEVEQALHVLASEEVDPASLAGVRVTPTLEGMEVEARGRVVSVRGRWAADQVYEVRFGSLATRDGVTMPVAAPLAVRSAGLAPSIRGASGRLTWERDTDGELPIAMVNAGAGTLRAVALDDGALVSALLGTTRRGAPGTAARRLHEVAPSERPNRWGTGRLSWSAISGGDAALVDVDADGAGPSPGRRSVMQRTDLGISVTTVADGALVWVTSLRRATPVPGATVTVYSADGSRAGEATADSDGLAWIPLAEGVMRGPMAVLARSPSDRAGLRVDRRTGEGPATFSIASGAVSRSAEAPVAAVVLDRGAVRPGERVRVKVIARQLSGGVHRALARQRVQLVLRGPAGVIETKPAQLSRAGTADAVFALDRSAQPGEYVVSVARGRESPMGDARFSVAEFRLPNARVDLTLARPWAMEGEAVRGALRARYLFGAPVTRAAVRWTLRRLGAIDPPVRWREFGFSPVDSTATRGTVESGDGELASDGSFELQATMHHALPAPEQVALEVSVRDASGQETAARQTMESRPAERIVGMRRIAPWVEHGQQVPVELVVLDRDNNPSVGAQVELKVYREGWHGYYQWAGGGEGDGGAWRARRERERELVSTRSLTSSADPLRAPWSPERSGTYVIEAATTDSGGRRSVASQRIYVAGPTERPDRDPPGAPFALTPARSEWSVGERAALSFECPWSEAEALVTVLHRGVAHRERRRVRSGSVQLTVPLHETMVPGALVSVTLLRARDAAPRPTGELDLGAPDVRWGVTELQVRPRVQVLDVSVRAAAESAPGSDVPIEVRVRDAEGRGVSTEVALYAVDEGVLRLSAYEIPDITRALLPRRATTFALEDLRRTLVSRVTLPALPGASGDGSEAGSMEDDALRDVREAYDPTPLWLPQLRTDSTGVARGVLHLPGRGAQYRVMALAVGEGLRSGRGATLVTARRDLALRALLPRALSEGDRFEAGALLNNTSSRAIDASVTTRVNGVDRSTRRVRVEAQGELRVGETLDAVGREMEVAIRVVFDAGEVTESRTIRVAPQSRGGRGSVLGAIAGRAEFTLEREAGVQDPAATLTLSAQPMLAMDAALARIDGDSTGSTASAAAKLLTWAALAPGGGATRSTWRPEVVRRRGEAALDDLLRAQLADGGFGHWGEESPFVPSITALALRAFDAARRAGWTVEAAAVERARSVLARWVRARGMSRYGADELALALRALHDAGADESSVVNMLFEQRELLREYGSAQLALAMMPDDPRRATLLSAAMNLMGASSSRVAQSSPLYHAQPMAIASALELATRMDRMELGGALAQQLLASVVADGGSDADPVSQTALTLDALARFSQRFHAAGPLDARVSLDGRPVSPTHDAEGVSVYRFDAASLSTGRHVVRVEAETSPLFTALDGAWRVLSGPDDEVARGRALALHRRFETESGAALERGASVPVGSLVRVRLWAYAERRTPPHLVLRSLHGGGFEAVDQGLDTTPQSSIEALLGMGIDDAANDPRVFHAFRSLGDITARRFYGGAVVLRLDYGFSGLREYTYALRATTPGRFVIPPAELGALYRPDAVARSASSVLVITR